MTDDNASLAERIRVAYGAADLADFANVLAPDVRWGDDDHPNRCRSRDDVLRTFSQWVDSGVTADVTGVESGPSGVMCRLHVNWRDPKDRVRGIDFIHVFLVRDGLIQEICRYDDLADARRAIGA